MLKKIKKIISKTDHLLFKKFGTDKSLKFLQNIKEAKVIFENLNEVGEETKVRFVGGCVRKALCGEIIDDIDLATSLEPVEVKKRLSSAYIRVIDTGISHGTVTAIINKKKFEITTLRQDVSTDGRHATVQYTPSWQEDAFRRDFTINAIYADIEGRIFDPLNGISDLNNRKIKFIGSPKERIQEDFLRILRYLRFFTEYSKSDHDEDAIKSIKQYINGLNQVSKERILDELKKILSLKNVYGLFSNKESKEIILNIFPQFKFYPRLKVFNGLNKQTKSKYNYILILALLILDHTDNWEFFCYKYKTSNNIKKIFREISEKIEDLKYKKFFSQENIKKLIYFNNKDFVKNILLFSKCESNKNVNLEELLDYVNYCKIPKFPLSGEDLKRQGYESGEVLGKKLKFLEKKWIENNFTIDKRWLEKSSVKIKRN
tara:strand:- start:1270 stop:2562 length:1293 start_codon:yes stop_codon:yes gene_type:complete